MVEYHITSWQSGGPLAGKTVIRHRFDAAWLVYNRAVDAMVKDNAGLDTLAGVRAQLSARALGPLAPHDRGHQVEYRGDKVLIERVD